MKLKFVLLALFIFLSTLSVAAQDKLQLGVRLSNTEFEGLFQSFTSTEYTQGISAVADFQLIKADAVRVGLSGKYQRKSIGTAFDFYGAGPSFQVFAGKVFSVRGAAHFGIVTDYAGAPKVFTRQYEAGPRLNLGKNLYIDPIVFTFTKSESLPVVERGFEFGAGLRF